MRNRFLKKLMKHKFRKKWGQNFLQDPNIIRNIIKTLNICKQDIVLEIGPGDGALTCPLSKYAKQIHAIEIDPILTKYLEAKLPQNVKLYNEDIMKFNLERIDDKVKIFSNLPYYITSPVIFKFLTWGKWDSMVLMTQKEVAERITAKPGSKIYGRISVMVQAFADVEICMKISKNVFYPIPKVDSSLIFFKKKKHSIENYEKFSLVVKKAFSQRRKKLTNNLKGFVSSEKLNLLGNSRAEDLSVTKFINLSK